MNTRKLGEISQLAVASALAKAGWTILMPYGDGQRYDLVIDGPDGFRKVQCKTGRLSDDGSVIAFNAQSTSAHGSVTRSYKGEVDYFGVYCPQLDKTYLIPMSDDLPDTEIALRILPSKNNQINGCRSAAEYEVKTNMPWRSSNNIALKRTRTPRADLMLAKQLCPQCQQSFKPERNSQIFCSITCAKNSKRRYALTDAELLDRLKTTSAERLGKELGVSGTAIRKRMAKMAPVPD